jgi:hypothetical protein
VIDWISTKERVPEDRRKVLAWGDASSLGASARSVFLGPTRYNPSPKGGRFDIEGLTFWTVSRSSVTHWAEITAPSEELRAPPRHR